MTGPTLTHRFQAMIKRDHASSLKLMVITLILTLAFMQVGAQVMTLEETIQTIERNNPMLKPYESKAQALDEYATGARSWMAPMVGVGTFMTPYPGQEVMEMDKGSIMFSVEQQIPNAGRLKATSKYMQSQAQIQRTTARQQFNMLRADARMLYYQWLVAEKRTATLEDNLATLKLMLELAEVRYPYNQGSLGDIYKLKGKIAEGVNMIAMNEGIIGESRARLLSMMNLPFDTTLMIDTTTTVAPITQVDTTGLLQRRTDLLALEQRIRSMELGREAQLAQGKPEFKLRFDHMQPLGDNMPKQFTAMGMISIPIAPWSSRMYRAEARGMAYDIQAMKEERLAIVNETSGRLAGLSKQLSTMKHHLHGYRESIIPALQKNFRATMLAYEENRGQLAMVLEGWDALNMMQVQYFEQLEAYYKMIADYEKELEL